MNKTHADAQMDRDFSNYWLRWYHLIGNDDEKKYLGMPDEEKYGLSRIVIEGYVKKRYILRNKITRIENSATLFGLILFIGLVFTLYMGIIIPIHVLGSLLGVGICYSIYRIYKYTQKKVYDAMKIDVFENFLHDYWEWYRKRDDAVLKAYKEKQKEIEISRRENNQKVYYEIIKEYMDDKQSIS